jgi:quinone-modifying oxidoreductase subunit QmoC
MSDSCLLKPDRAFVARIVGSGGEDLKKCYQCATCSVVCELAPDSRPFPRKEMIWAQWGLKDRLLADPDVWLCHQCNDCSTHCPRGARPADVLASVRQQTIDHYALPGFLPNWVNHVKYLPLTGIISVVVLVLALIIRDPVSEALSLGEPHGFYAAFFPHWLLIAFFSTLTLVSFVLAMVSITRFWRSMKAADAAAGRNPPVQGFVPSAIAVFKSIVTHDKFGKCQSAAPRRWAHLTAFYGFMALFAVTIYAVADLYVFPHIGLNSVYPFNLMHPMKILANIGCAILIYGCIKAIIERRSKKRDASASTSFDWIFVWLLLLVAVTGLVTEIMRFAVDPGGDPVAGALEAGRSGPEYLAFAIYFVHLVLVFQLLVYLPYSKFAHIFYRTIALVYAEYSGRNRGLATSGNGRQEATAGSSEPAPAPT